MCAPIVVFAFNRLESLKTCIASLLHNKEAAESDLIVFVDGPRANKKDEAAKVDGDENGVGLECLTREFGLFGR